MPYTRADKMSTRYSSIHSAYAHRLIPRRKSSRKEAEHSLRYCQGQERGDSGFATLRYRALSYTVTSIANVATPACLSLLRRKDTLGKASLRPSDERTNQRKMEEKTIDNKKKEEVIRFKTTTDQKEKIERAAEKRGITVSEYLRQSANSKMSRERPMDWYSTIERLESICAATDGETRVALIDLIRDLYKGGA